MIGKAKACKGGGILASYVTKEGKGYELDRNLIAGDTPQEISREMRVIQDLNTDPRAENKTFSLVLSPDSKDGWALSDKELREMSRDFMKKIGIDPEKQQFLSYVHTETEYKHIHIVANRVQRDGSMISDQFIGKRAQQAAHEIAIERGLVSAREVPRGREKGQGMGKARIKAIRKEIMNIHQEVMQEYPQDLESYYDMMKRHDIEVTPTINKQGKLQGHRFKHLASGLDFKASQVHRSLGLKNLMSQGLPTRTPELLPKQLLPLQVKALKLAVKLARKIMGLSRSY